MLGPGASWQGGPGGTHRVGRSILSHGRSVSIIVEHNCWVEEQSQTFHPTWGGGQLQTCFCLQSMHCAPSPVSQPSQDCQSPSQKTTATAPRDSISQRAKPRLQRTMTLAWVRHFEPNLPKVYGVPSPHPHTHTRPCCSRPWLPQSSRAQERR